MDRFFKTAVSALLAASLAFSGVASAGAFEIRDTEPQRDKDASEYVYYYSEKNIFQNMGYGMPNCTAYVWGRIFEILGKEPVFSTGNAGRWYMYNADRKIYSYGSIPKEGAVACWDHFDNVNGHVAVVESVSADRNTVQISESQWNGKNFETYKMKSDSSGSWRGYRFLGYIYPDETDARFYGDAFKIKSPDSDIMLTYGESLSLEMNAPLSNTAIQNFRFEPAGNGNYKIWSVSEELLLYGTDGEVSLMADDGSAACEWKLLSDLNGMYTICRPENTDKVLTFSQNDAVVSDYSAGSSQIWDISRVTGETELDFINREIELTLDCTNAKTLYTTNEFLDLTNVIFRINGNAIDDIDILKLSTEYDFSTAGQTTVTVNYGSLSGKYEVTVEAPTIDKADKTSPEVISADETISKTKTSDKTVSANGQGTISVDGQGTVSANEQGTASVDGATIRMSSVSVPADESPVCTDENHDTLLLSSVKKYICGSEGVEFNTIYDINDDNKIDAADALLLS